MLINVLDSSLKKVAIISNELPNAPSYYNDEFHDYLEQGATTFSFTVAKVINNQLQGYTQFLSHQSYFSFRKNGRDYLMTPSSEQAVHETSTEISFFCVSLDRELINEQANPFTNTSSHNIQWYFDQMGLISRTQLTIGVNEVSNLTRTLNYDGQETKLSRLISVINNFNAEFDFVTTLNNDGSLDSVILNIYKENDGVNVQGVGTKRNDVRLTFGKNIEDVEVDISDEGFFNACYMTGADGLSWKDSDFSYKNADGLEEFYKRKGSEIAYAPLSAQMFPSQLKADKGDIWTSIDRTTEYTNVNDMWGYIVKEFKQYAYHQITYTVTPSSTLVNQLVGDGRPLQKGDTVIIQDNNYMDIDGNIGLILSARVSEIVTSDTNPENNQIVFSNYRKLKNEASSDIQSIVNQMVDKATPYFADITTSNGVQFKNGTGSTDLSAHIYKGSSTTETIADSYEWSKDGTDVANVQEITVDASGVTDKVVYTFKATIGGNVVASQSVTITNVNDGEEGKAGIDGRSVTNIEQKYRVTKTGTVPGDPWDSSVWQTAIPEMNATNKFLWSITRTTFNKAPITQDIIEQKAVYGDKGDDGSKGDPGKIVSETEPTTKFKGLTWKYSGSADMTASDGTVILSGTEYYWSGTNWELNEINAHNINGDNLNVTNGTFADGKIKSTWDSGTASGSTEIENSHINMSATDSSSKATNSLGLDVQQGFAMRWTDPVSNQTRSVLLDYGDLSFERNGVAAGLSFDGTNLSSSMPIQAPNTIVKSTQFTVSGIGIRLDRMMSFVTVTFSGQASSTINNTPTINNVLPVGFRPISPYSIDYMVPGNTANNGYIYFNPDGSIRIMATINSGYYIRGTRHYITSDVYPS
ncbi:phage tail protein [Lactococcus lactis]|uniref:phage tail protein n=1 Tax=Lactococcus lactis TaxID=1358 RepID=UPI00210E9209|nr:phage tail protein [Lactococcus lactis]MCQ4972169.1 phage tail protein [Lactococcus lactis]MCQ4997975.1 phage tail protein [Lactococcus lactis]